MKTTRNLLLLCLVALFATTTNAAADETEIQNQKLQQAIRTTQLLSARICGNKAELDPQVLARHSSAVMFILALQTVGTVDDMAKKPDLVAEKMRQMTCGQGGILQFDPRIS